VEDDIREIAESIWETLFTRPLVRTTAGPPVREPTVTGCVTIEGAWHGAILLSCERVVADALAAELFRSPSPSGEEVRDTVGELTNMLAGNIKALLPDPSRISLPTVAAGGDFDLSVVGTSRVAGVQFRCGEGALEVTVHQGRPAQGEQR
jgi:chemotaxis protein CheX